MARSVRRLAGVSSLALAIMALTACGGAPEPLPIDAYLAPPPAWRGLPPPSPVPDLASGVQLVGMDTGDLRSVLGEPALVRVEGGVQYWRYAFAGCGLDLFVDARPGRAPEVVYYELREAAQAGSAEALSDCRRLGRQLDQGGERPAPRRELPRIESF